MAVWSKLLEVVPRSNPRAIIAAATLGAGVMFYVNRRVVDARQVVV